VPHAVGARDVLVHFDSTSGARGKLQKGRKYPPILNVYTKNDGTTFWLYVLGDDYRLDVARQPAGSVLEVLSD
jgi:hypothetical protein